MQIHEVFFIPYVYFLLMVVRTVILCLKNRINVIRAYNTQLEGLAAVLSGFLLRVPVVVSVHGNYDELVKVRGYNRVIRFFVHVIELFVLNRASAIFCVSDGVRDDIVKKGISPHKVKVTYNKVESHLFYNAIMDQDLRHKGRAMLGIDSSEFVILHVGRFNVQKNIPVLFYAVKRLRDEGIPATLLLVGDDPVETVSVRKIDKPLRTIFEEQVRSLGISKYVRMVGFVPHNELRIYYAMSDVFAFPTLVYGFGIALAEAQSAGLPIVASDVLFYGDKACLVSPSNALLFNPNNPDSLVDCLRRLYLSDSLKRELHEASLRAGRRFAWDRVATLEAEFYKEIINEHSRRQHSARFRKKRLDHERY
jgi:glycosyltransferase involved in cell wall biosynthesis